MRMVRNHSGLLIIGVVAAVLVGMTVLGVLGDFPARVVADDGLSVAVPPPTGQARAGSIRNKIGYSHAELRMGEHMPNGQGIVVGQVEGVFQNGYLAKRNVAELKGTRFIPESGPGLASSHATMVARYITGNDSAGHGVTEIHGWQVSDWLGPGMLNTGLAKAPRSDHPARVFNHSWVGGGGKAAPNILRRIDYLIDKHDLIMVCGVNNKPGGVPNLLASAYNVISVGVTAGDSSDGLTTIEGAGRCKPELAAPGKLSSWTTGTVTGCVAALLEYADRMVEQDKSGRNKDAAKSEVIKAALLAGANRFKDWDPPAGEPLARKVGAGVVDLDRSLLILGGGHAEPDKPTTQRYGWSFSQIASEQQRTYTFTITQPQGLTGIALVWHRRVVGGTIKIPHPETGEPVAVWNASARSADLDMELAWMRPGGGEKIIATSASKVDNVERIDLRNLAPGKYELRITRKADKHDEDWDYALAWRIEGWERDSTV